MSAQRLAIKTSQKPWGNSITNTAGWPRSEVVANFRLLTGYDCLAKHLYHIGLDFPPIHQREEMDQRRLLRAIVLFSTFESHRYWEASGRMGE
jgi:hypothetical protein